MVWFETQEANASIQDLNETTSYIAKEYEPRKQRKILTTKIKFTPIEQKKKSNLLNIVNTEHVAQTIQQIDQNKIKSKEF